MALQLASLAETISFQPFDYETDKYAFEAYELVQEAIYNRGCLRADFDKYQDRARTRANYFVEANDCLIGVGALDTQELHTKAVIEITDVAVRSQYRKQGIGKLLINGLEQEARRMRARNVKLISLDNDASAFYSKLGYGRPNFATPIMSKSL